MHKRHQVFRCTSDPGALAACHSQVLEEAKPFPKLSSIRGMEAPSTSTKCTESLSSCAMLLLPIATWLPWWPRDGWLLTIARINRQLPWIMEILAPFPPRDCSVSLRIQQCISKAMLGEPPWKTHWPLLEVDKNARVILVISVISGCRKQGIPKLLDSCHVASSYWSCAHSAQISTFPSVHSWYFLSLASPQRNGCRYHWWKDSNRS